jgi:hypothetical protein
VITYALDPGKHKTSCAGGIDGSLKWITQLTADKPLGVAGAPGCRIILEVPRSHSSSAHKANDLIDEITQGAIIAGRIAQATGGPIVIVHPSTTTEAGRKGWKGQVPKPLHHRRILAALSPSELAIITAIKPDVVAYVEAACQRYAVSKKVTKYSASGAGGHDDLDAVGLLLEDAGRI